MQQYLEGKLRAPSPAASAAAGPTGHVIVVGAGPAGLTAALHLQVILLSLLITLIQGLHLHKMLDAVAAVLLYVELACAS